MPSARDPCVMKYVQLGKVVSCDSPCSYAALRFFVRWPTQAEHYTLKRLTTYLGSPSRRNFFDYQSNHLANK